MRDAAVDVDTGTWIVVEDDHGMILVEQLSLDSCGQLSWVLFRVGADGSISVYPASPRVLLPGQSSPRRKAKPQPAPARAQAVPKPESDGRPARAARAQPDSAAPKAPRKQDLGRRESCH
jgi:hypothetical protein